MHHRPSGTVVFLFTDIEGSTRLWEKYRDEMSTDLSRHDAIIREIAEINSGYVFKSVGDAFCMAFSTVSDAMTSALDVQIALDSESWDVPNGIKVRMAIHAGEVEERDEDYFGPTVNRVARLLSAGHGGQTLLSAVAAEIVKESPPEGSSLRSLGSHRLKDLSQSQQIFQLVHPRLPSDFPSLVTLDSRPNNLRCQPTQLIGREKELTAVLNLLTVEDVRLLTLTGPEGTGKTRLGIQAAADLVDQFEHGIYFVDLSVLSDPERVFQVIAQVLDVRESMGQGRPLFEILKDYLKNREMLLLLDNFEHVVSAAGQVVELLEVSPRLKVLVTTRESLHVRGEREYPVPPLSLPEAGIRQTVERLTQYEAVRLIIERAVAVKPEFAVTNENAPAVAEICVRLDGLPLAIELAASRLKVLSPQDLLKRLADRLRLLKGGSRDLPERLQTLRRAIGWSYDLLDEGERDLFKQLSVFYGGCTLEAAEQVCLDPKGDSELDVLDGLASLVDKSLLRQSEVAGETRFWMLETIREYSRMRLEESSEAEAVKQRHAEYFLELAEQADLKLHGSEEIAWLDRMERENNNLQGAMAWFLNNEMAEESLRLGVNLEWYWRMYGYSSDGKRLLEEAFSLVDLSGDELEGNAKITDLWAKGLNSLGWMVFIQGGWFHSRSLFRDSLELFKKTGNRRGEATALARLGVAERWLGEIAVGTEHCEEAVRIAREVGDLQSLVSTLIWAYATTGGKYVGEAPRSELEEAVELSRKLGDLWGKSCGLNGLGDLLRESGNYGEARPLYEEALKGFRKLKDRWMTAWSLEGLGWASYLDGENKKAEEYLQEGMALFDLLGDKGNTIFLLRRLGMVARSEGDHPRAACLLGAHKAIHGTIIGSDSASRMEYSPEVSAAFPEYQNDYVSDWTRGQAMSSEQAVEYALEVSDGT